MVFDVAHEARLTRSSLAKNEVVILGFRVVGAYRTGVEVEAVSASPRCFRQNQIYLIRFRFSPRTMNEVYAA